MSHEHPGVPENAPAHEKNYGIPMPSPTPEHQQKITREKWFEIAIVVLFIAGGSGFLAARNYFQNNRSDPARTLAESERAMVGLGGEAAGSKTIFGRQFKSYEQPIDGFMCHVDLIGPAPDVALETAVAWLTPLPGKKDPSPDSLQKAVNRVGVLGQTLVQAFNDAFDKAAKTMKLEANTKRPHDKGVAGTSDGWKLTYVTYRSYDENASPPQPVLCVVLQRLTVASDDALSVFNRALYQAIDDGVDIKSALQSAQGSGKI